MEYWQQMYVLQSSMKLHLVGSSTQKFQGRNYLHDMQKREIADEQHILMDCPDLVEIHKNIGHPNPTRYE